MNAFESTAFTYTTEQQAAIERALAFLKHPTEREFCIKGYAGTGKTTSIQAVVKGSPHLRWAFTAPTNKASRVLREMAAGAGIAPEVATTYSLLGLKLSPDGEVKRIRSSGNARAMDYDVVVVDEASMVNPTLRREINTAAEESGLKVIYMGDPLQLPPVGFDSSSAFDVPNVVELTEVVRQAAGNPIIAATATIREAIVAGHMPVLKTSKTAQGGLYVMPPDKWNHWLKSGFNSATYERDPATTFRAIAWTNRRVNALNFQVRRILYPNHYRDRFIPGERVIAAQPVAMGGGGEDTEIVLTTDAEATVERVTVMPHPVYGDLFQCYGLELTDDEGAMVPAAVIHENSLEAFKRELDRRSEAAKKNPRLWPSFWEFHDLFNDIRPCHAITAHRSQGSTYDNVFVDVGDIMANRRFTEALRCLYVAVSRAATNVMLTGV